MENSTSFQLMWFLTMGGTGGNGIVAVMFTMRFYDLALLIQRDFLILIVIILVSHRAYVILVIKLIICAACAYKT